MTRPMMREHNLETGEVIDREMTKAEHDAYLKSCEPEPLTAEQIAAQEAKASAAAKLEALGLTVDDLKALGL